MASTINASTSGAGGLITTADASGQLELQTAGTTAVTINGSQVASFANNFGTVADYPAYQCRAWVNFNGTGTVAIRASGNVSSITDNGTGLYTVNFTTAMPDANYAIAAAAQALTNSSTVSIYAAAVDPSPLTTTSFPISVRADTGTAIDTSTVTIAVFR